MCPILGLLDPESYEDDLSTLKNLLGDARYACERASADYGTSSSCLPSSVALASVIYPLDRVDDPVLSEEEQKSILKRAGRAMPNTGIAEVRYALARLRELHATAIAVNADRRRQTVALTISKSDDRERAFPG